MAAERPKPSSELSELSDRWRLVKKANRVFVQPPFVPALEAEPAKPESPKIVENRGFKGAMGRAAIHLKEIRETLFGEPEETT